MPKCRKLVVVKCVDNVTYADARVLCAAFFAHPVRLRRAVSSSVERGPSSQSARRIQSRIPTVAVKILPPSGKALSR